MGRTRPRNSPHLLAGRKDRRQALFGQIPDPGEDEPGFVAGAKKHGSKLNTLMKEAQLQMAQVQAWVDTIAALPTAKAK